MEENIMKDIVNSNRLIAEFMGIRTKVYIDTPTITHYNFNNNMLTPNLMRYHTSWDWLMPVVEKIESLPNELCVEYFWNNDDTKQHNDFRIFRVAGITELYSQIIEFIKWYNLTLSNQTNPDQGH